MRFVAVKTVEQQDVQAVHRTRSGLIEQRTVKGNQIRGLVHLEHVFCQIDPNPNKFQGDSSSATGG